MLALGFAMSTPTGIAVSVVAQPENATRQTLINGIFDSILAGILMYTGLIELLAHHLMFTKHMRTVPLKIQRFGFECVVDMGACLMVISPMGLMRMRVCPDGCS